ncbi:MAG TPA: STAS domain-containing protein [Actinomycetota bacterium]
MRTSQALTTRIDARNDVTSIALSGELDMATVPILNDQLTALEQDGSKVILLDLRDLNFIDSSGLHAFVQAYSRSQQNGHRFLLVGASPIAQRLFEITGTEFLLDGAGNGTATRPLHGTVTDGEHEGEVGAEPHV